MNIYCQFTKKNPNQTWDVKILILHTVMYNPSWLLEFSLWSWYENPPSCSKNPESTPENSYQPFKK